MSTTVYTRTYLDKMNLTVTIKGNKRLARTYIHIQAQHCNYCADIV